MPTEKRRHDRVRARLKVSYGLTSADCTAAAENISESGMYINTNQPFKNGTRLILQIEFPDRLFVHRGEFVWTIQATEHLRGELICGMGLKFIDPAPEWPRFFREWMMSIQEPVPITETV